MERKIGEIFEYNGEWYQCIKVDPIINADGIINYCEGCSISASECDNFNCIDDQRSDKELVIFKKLVKLGESFERNGYMYQEYKAHTFPLLMNEDAKIPTPNGFAVIIKQNKDMEEKKLNLKPFNLEAAKSGKPVCTRDGRKVRIICFDAIGYHQPIIALVTNFDGKEDIETYYLNGHFNDDIADVSDYDLMMVSEKKEGWVNVYYDNDTSSHRGCRYIYDTKEQAIKSAGEGYITTVKIPWEE